MVNNYPEYIACLALTATEAANNVLLHKYDLKIMNSEHHMTDSKTNLLKIIFI